MRYLEVITLAIVLSGCTSENQASNTVSSDASQTQAGSHEVNPFLRPDDSPLQSVAGEISKSIPGNWIDRALPELVADSDAIVHGAIILAELGRSPYEHGTRGPPMALVTMEIIDPIKGLELAPGSWLHFEFTLSMPSTTRIEDAIAAAGGDCIVFLLENATQPRAEDFRWIDDEASPPNGEAIWLLFTPVSIVCQADGKLEGGPIFGSATTIALFKSEIVGLL